jgi:hypothetical protein
VSSLSEPATYEQLFPLYRVTERRDGEVYRTRPVGEAWLPVNTAVGSEVESEVRVGTPDRLRIRRAE